MLGCLVGLSDDYVNFHSFGLAYDFASLLHIYYSKQLN